MNIYFVTSWGNETDGGDGPDTNILVSASDLDACIAVADRWLASYSASADSIKLLGVNSEVSEECVIHGPWIATSITNGGFAALYRECDWQASEEDQ